MFDFSFMNVALDLARQASSRGAVPVGAVVVHQGKIVAQAHNDMPIDASLAGLPEPLCHAEVLAMAMACKVLGVRRLDGCLLYVTLEPCPFCRGAIGLMHISKVIFGAYAPRAKAGSFGEGCEVLGGILERESAALLSDFFKEKREVGDA